MLMLADSTALDGGATFGAYVIAFLGLLGAIHSKYDARQVKQQADLVAIRAKELEVQQAEDKLTHDAEIVELKVKNMSLTDSWKRTHEELAECRQDHRDSEVKHRVSEADRLELRKKLEKLESLMAAREARSD